jgi:hypothetical protein
MCSDSSNKIAAIDGSCNIGEAASCSRGSTTRKQSCCETTRWHAVVVRRTPTIAVVSSVSSVPGDTVVTRGSTSATSGSRAGTLGSNGCITSAAPRPRSLARRAVRPSSGARRKGAANAPEFPRRPNAWSPGSGERSRAPRLSLVRRRRAGSVLRQMSHPKIQGLGHGRSAEIVHPFGLCWVRARVRAQPAR